MQILRTFLWAMLLVALVAFSVANWTDVTVRIWPGLVVDTKIPAIVIISFAIGFVPMWLYLRASKWQSRRRIQSLENAARMAQTTPVQPEPVAASAVEATPVVASEPDVSAVPPLGADPLSPYPSSSSKPENP